MEFMRFRFRATQPEGKYYDQKKLVCDYGTTWLGYWRFRAQKKIPV